MVGWNMKTGFRPIIDDLEERSLCTVVGPPYAPGIIKGHIEIETYAPGANLIEAIQVAKDIQEVHGNPTPSRSGFIVK